MPHANKGEKRWASIKGCWNVEGYYDMLFCRKHLHAKNAFKGALKSVFVGMSHVL